MNILFICSQNKWRSRTAESIFKNSNFHQVKSAGTRSTAQIKISQKLLYWSDLIFVMEKKHKEKIVERFDVESEIIILDIFDDYQYMDAELVELLKTSVSSFIEI